MASDRDTYEFITRFRTEALGAARQAEDALRGMGDAADGVEESTENATDAMAELGTAAGEMITAFGALAVAFVPVIRGLRDFADLETQLVGVAKTSDLSAESMGRLGERFQSIASQTGLLVSDLTEAAQVAGQLGVQGADNIANFAETIVRLGGASNLVGEEAATALARLLNVTGENIETVDVLASTIVGLGNNVAATEREIAHMATGIAQSTAAFGTSSTFAVGLGSAFAELGLRAETSATSVGRFFTSMTMAAATGSGDAVKFADAMGLTLEQFQALMNDNAPEAYMELMRAMADMDGSDALMFLDDLSLANSETLRSITPLLNNWERVEHRMSLASDEAERNTALTLENARAQDTLARDVRAYQEALRVTSTELGETFAPAARLAITTARDLVVAFNEMDDTVKDVVHVLGLVVPAVVGVRLAVVALSRVLGLLRLGAVATAFAGVTAGAGTATIAVGALRAALALLGGPIGALVIGGAALATALLSSEDNLGELTEATDNGSTAFDEYSRVLRQVAEDQGNLEGAVTATTNAMAIQARQALSEQQAALREEIEVAENDLTGVGLFDNDNFNGLTSTISANVRGQAQGIQDILLELQARIDAFREDTSLENTTALDDMLDRILAVGPEAAGVLEDTRVALDGIASGTVAGSELPSIAQSLLDYADAAGLAGEHVNQLREQTANGIVGPEALAGVMNLIQNFSAVSSVVGRELADGTLDLVDALREAKEEAAVNELLLQGNVEGAMALRDSYSDVVPEVAEIVTTTTEAVEEADRLAMSAQDIYEAYGDVPEQVQQIADLLGISAFEAQQLVDTMEQTTGIAFDGTIQSIIALMNTLSEAGIVAGGLASILLRIGGITGDPTMSPGYRDPIDPRNGMEAPPAHLQEGYLDGIETNVMTVGESLSFQSGIGRTGVGGTGDGDDDDGGGGGGGANSAEGLDEMIGLTGELVRERQEAVRLLEEDMRAMGQTTYEAARARAEAEMINEARRAGIDIDRQLSDSGRTYREEIEATAAAVAELAVQEEERQNALDAAAERQEFFNQQQEALKEGILDTILEGESLVDVLHNIGKAFARAALEAALFGSGPLGGGGGGGLLGGLFGGGGGGKGGGGGFLGGLFSSILSAQGNVFDNGQRVGVSTRQFALGGMLDEVRNAAGYIVRQSRTIPMANGNALIGEAGPEAVVPLTRGPGGVLGINSYGGNAQSGMVLNYQPVFNINTGGGGGEESSAPGAESELAKMLDREVQQKVTEIFVRESRPGGMLSQGVKPYGN